MPNNMIFLAVHLFLSKRMPYLYPSISQNLRPSVSVRELAPCRVRPHPPSLSLSPRWLTCACAASINSRDAIKEITRDPSTGFPFTDLPSAAAGHRLGGNISEGQISIKACYLTL